MEHGCENHSREYIEMEEVIKQNYNASKVVVSQSLLVYIMPQHIFLLRGLFGGALNDC